MRKIGKITAAILVTALSACGTAVAPPSKKSGDATATTFYVTSFDPASSTLTAPPTTVTISFNENDLNENTVNALSNYNIKCGTNYVASDSVTRTPGTLSAVITLPAITGLASGTQCTFVVSTNILDADGVNLSGTNTATYRIQ